MPGKYLLDTNIAIALMNDEEGMAERFADEGHYYLSVVVMGELYYGAAKSAHPKRNLGRADVVANRMRAIFPCDQQTALVYGELKAKLKALGRPIPSNDVWIAATAFQHGLTLLTRDPHFDLIDELERERW